MHSQVTLIDHEIALQELQMNIKFTRSTGQDLIQFSGRQRQCIPPSQSMNSCAEPPVVDVATTVMPLESLIRPVVVSVRQDEASVLNRRVGSARRGGVGPRWRLFGQLDQRAIFVGCDQHEVWAAVLGQRQRTTQCAVEILAGRLLEFISSDDIEYVHWVMA